MAEPAVARSEDEILDELHALDEQKQKIRHRMRELNEELTYARARAEVDAMPDAKRAALLQVIQAEGVPSKEAIGG